MSDMKLLLKQLDRLAIVLDVIMPRTALVVRNAIELLKKQQNEIWELQEQVEYLTDKKEDR